MPRAKALPYLYSRYANGIPAEVTHEQGIALLAAHGGFLTPNLSPSKRTPAAVPHEANRADSLTVDGRAVADASSFLPLAPSVSPGAFSAGARSEPTHPRKDSERPRVSNADRALAQAKRFGMLSPEGARNWARAVASQPVKRETWLEWFQRMLSPSFGKEGE